MPSAEVLALTRGGTYRVSGEFEGHQRRSRCRLDARRVDYDDPYSTGRIIAARPGFPFLAETRNRDKSHFQCTSAVGLCQNNTGWVRKLVKLCDAICICTLLIAVIPITTFVERAISGKNKAACQAELGIDTKMKKKYHFGHVSTNDWACRIAQEAVVRT